MVNKRNESKNKGITLIALVVTIVVLLILAVTSYNLIIGNDGILIEQNMVQMCMKMQLKMKREN